MSTIEQALAKKLAERESQHSEEKQPDNSAEVSGIHKEQVITSTESTANNYFEIDTQKLSNNDFIIQDIEDSKQTLIAEFRQIKRKLLNNAFGAVAKTLQNPNLIMITSPKANEGKTFIALNLALSIAQEQDKTVLLIDADVLRPSVLNECGVKSKPGLIEYLLNDSKDIRDIIYHTNIDNLKIIPAGTPHHLSNELLASERMAKLAQELSSRYPDRVVIFDSPPLLGISETSVLAQLMGQALIAVEENRTSLHDVQQASALLHDELAKGLVLNKAFHAQKELYGYYGYGYGKRTPQ
ncbi:XrtA-associated tyrosine autokinase [Thalassotalea nanhaiensis]|uniref:non-specific protein-tyrosine kinase n=1 Tax=Thalassotalea nanhaiensis TaxID=3065648 RepID=A0ABY9TI79_9GAMM|nr:XrtA-associated tyrosine autokinase [Colwelliaceae bacterium SQ345]